MDFKSFLIAQWLVWSASVWLRFGPYVCVILGDRSQFEHKPWKSGGKPKFNSRSATPASGGGQGGSLASPARGLDVKAFGNLGEQRVYTTISIQDGRQGVWRISTIFRAASSTHQGPFKLLHVSTRAWFSLRPERKGEITPIDRAAEGGRDGHAFPLRVCSVFSSDTTNHSFVAFEGRFSTYLGLFAVGNISSTMIHYSEGEKTKEIWSVVT